MTGSDSDAGEYFGISVAVSGNRMLVGCMLDDIDNDGSGGLQEGSVYVFEYNASNQSWQEIDILTASIVTIGFGYSVGISGDIAIIGQIAGYGDGAYIFEYKYNETNGTNETNGFSSIVVYTTISFAFFGLCFFESHVFV